jgi:UDP-glucuronate decarboxylase
MKKGIDSPINLGNPNEFSMLELAERIIQTSHSSSPLVFEPLPADDPRQRRPDIARAKTILGWEPTIELELNLVISYFLSFFFTFLIKA